MTRNPKSKSPEPLNPEPLNLDSLIYILKFLCKNELTHDTW
jgi:hypothetical protein